MKVLQFYVLFLKICKIKYMNYYNTFNKNDARLKDLLLLELFGSFVYSPYMCVYALYTTDIHM